MAMSSPDWFPYSTNCLKSVSESMMPLENTSFARTVPKGCGTLLYALIISRDVAWNSNSGPLTPHASRLTTARTESRV